MEGGDFLAGLAAVEIAEEHFFDDKMKIFHVFRTCFCAAQAVAFFSLPPFMVGRAGGGGF